eukprot:TRINITY_DN112217_c0_g1_i1.p1 TRINITY_DN112217_c0_g1~~TRINITY_DN112217_c0_g1_i1.p1  ORF type:complete len:367 (+),score=106.97 TRINITY_DN112217_c0_g1_i1:76-1176(+)
MVAKRPTHRANVLANHVVSGHAGAAHGEHQWVERPTPGTVAMVGAPLCEGQPLGGVKLAPDAFRKAGVEKMVKKLTWGFEDRGDVPPAEELMKAAAPGKKDGEYYPDSKVHNSAVVGAGVGAVYRKVAEAAKEGKFVLTVGGDHSIGSGTIAGMLEARPETAVIWVDAHGDCNTPDTSPSGNYHGMPLGHILGWFQKRVEGFEWCDDHIEKQGPLQEARTCLIALRDLDAEERQLLRKSNVHVYSMADIDRHGIGEVMEMALDAIDPKRRLPLHLSFDIDSCDPEIAPGTGTKARGGLSFREAHYICERMAMTGRLKSMDIVEVNPALDDGKEAEKMHGDDEDIGGSATVRFSMELVASALGKSII